MRCSCNKMQSAAQGNIARMHVPGIAWDCKFTLLLHVACRAGRRVLWQGRKGQCMHQGITAGDSVSRSLEYMLLWS